MTKPIPLLKVFSAPASARRPRQYNATHAAVLAKFAKAKHGLTDRELAMASSLTASTARFRRIELEHFGFIARDGKRKNGRNSANVFHVTPLGRERLKAKPKGKTP